MADGEVLSTFRGISLGSLITGAGVWTGVFTLFGIILRSRVPMRKMKIAADEKLIDTLSKRVDKLEADLAEQRTFYETKISNIQTSYETKMDRLQATSEANGRVSRHELNNVKMRFRALVMLLKRLPNPPEMLVAILADIEAMEAEQALAEAAEKGAQAGAQIIAATPPGTVPVP
jgi:uncharacterized membrane protein YccC